MRRLIAGERLFVDLASDCGLSMCTANWKAARSRRSSFGKKCPPQYRQIHPSIRAHAYNQGRHSDSLPQICAMRAPYVILAPGWPSPGSLVCPQPAAQSRDMAAGLGCPAFARIAFFY